MSPHLSAKLLKPASPRLHLDIAVEDSDDDMVYAPYYRTPYPHPHRCSTSKPRRRSTQLSAEVRADIVARVLDPAYSGRHRDNYSSRVIIDPNGDEHDPDYQLFPTIYPTRHRQTTSGFFRRVPSEDDLTQDDNDDDDAESIIAWTRERAASPMTSSGSSACTPSPPPNPLSLFGDDEWDEKEWTKEVVVPVPPQKRRKSKAIEPTVYIPNSPAIPTPSFDEPAPTPAFSQSAVKLVREDTMDTTDETPSCGYVLRRQWATFALQTRLSAHRIARRARRVVSVGT
ncbi:hypothetical protein RSOLAG22IIIB_12443 [Rhizoctonia solani]|uniref:Uncharacterized protein n=1 Tax=Rhizoctonia solani TaxID=456999 RepID=A0A0K6GER3_9AGAM|nr:hypothetical protein RSOLAG22IIIB_12443 [Rhizoctonia solani]